MQIEALTTDAALSAHFSCRPTCLSLTDIRMIYISDQFDLNPTS